MALLYGHAECLTAKNGGSRPGRAGCLTDPPRGKGYSVQFPSALDCPGPPGAFQWR
jgi:hypothetical protein